MKELREKLIQIQSLIPPVKIEALHYQMNRKLRRVLRKKIKAAIDNKDRDLACQVLDAEHFLSFINSREGV